MQESQNIARMFTFSQGEKGISYVKTLEVYRI